ncbi:MAG: LysM peptidoglycan-binding domain-containing protein [Bacteroidota bacterium]|nr:LysM peptidoglycan-binding domain-containing protein [Bacteroidota bacterium]
MKFNVFVLLFIIAFNWDCKATITDSVGVIEQKGSFFIVYKIEKETIYSISRKYNVSVKLLTETNPEIEKGVKIGQKILIPIVKSSNNDNTNYVYHTVESGQTLYAISKKYNVVSDDIKYWNKLPGNDLKVGSRIIVSIKKETKAIAELSVQKVDPIKTENPKVENEPTKQPTIEPVSSDTEIKVEKGNVQLYENADGDRFYYALHRTAQIGSIIRITNPVNEVKIFARVVGKMPSETDKSVVISLTKIALEKLQTQEKGVFVMVEIMP